MTDAILPTLNSGTQKILKTKESICAYILYFFFTNPGNISSIFDDISFRKYEAKHETDPEELKFKIQNSLQETMNSYLVGQGVSVELQIKDENETSYGFEINIINNDGTPVLDTRKVRISDGKAEIIT